MPNARKFFSLTPEECAADLRDAFPPGSTAYTILRHVSASGMSRAIDVYSMPGGDPRWMSPRVAVLLDDTWSDKWEAISVPGCGMDMGFHVVYNMSAALYGHGQNARDMPPRIPLSPRDARRLRDWRRRERNRYGANADRANVSGGYAVSHRWV